MSSSSENETMRTAPTRKTIRLFGTEIEVEIYEPMSIEEEEKQQKRVRVAADEEKAAAAAAVDDDDVAKFLIKLSQIDTNFKVYRDVIKDLNYFISKVKKCTGNADFELKKRRVNLFVSLGCVNVLAALYLSPVKFNQEVGALMIHRFLTGLGEWDFNWKLHVYAATAVLQLCTCLRGKEPPEEDKFYYDCRSTLGNLLVSASCRDQASVDSVFQRSVPLLDIFPLVIECGEKLLDEMAKSLESTSEKVITLEGCSEFSCFVIAFVNGILEVTSEYPISMPNGALVHPFCEQLQLLYQLFGQLRDKMGLCLARANHHIEDIRGGVLSGANWEYLKLIKALHAVSKIYKGAGESIIMMLEMGRSTFQYLVLQVAFEDIYDCESPNNKWIFEYKELLSFEARWHLAQKFFPVNMEDLEDAPPTTDLEMLVDRSELLADSCGFITEAYPGSLQEGLSIQFKNETATGPGVFREWITLVCKEIFNPGNSLFTTNPTNHRSFYINPASIVQPRHLEYFRFCGTVIALALMNQVQVGVAFERVLFNQLAGLDVQLEDIRDTDPSLYRSCKHVLDMDADLVDSDALGLTFSIEFDYFGSRRSVALRPGGENVKVNSRNRAEYIKELIHHRFLLPTSGQVAHLSHGFEDVLNSESDDSLFHFLRCLKLEDVNQMLCGSESDICVEDWKAHTFVTGYAYRSREITWFWKIVEEMPKEKRRLLLFFWTTVKYLPIEGFSGLPRRLEICKATGTSIHLPSSNTCFNRLCLPPYPTYRLMRMKIEVIVQEHVAVTFGIK